MKLLVLLVALLAGCGSFRAADEAPDASGGGADASVDGPGSSADAGADGATSGSKRCSDHVAAAYCEDFADREDVDDVVAAFPGGTKQEVGNPKWKMVDGPVGAPSRALEMTFDTTGNGDSQLIFPFAALPPPRLRLFARLRIDEISRVDVLALGFTRVAAENEYVYVTIMDGQLRLAEFDSGGSVFAPGGLAVAAGVTYDVELRVELASGGAALFVNGARAGSLVLSRVLASDGMTGFRLQYGLFADGQPRAPARVTYDDIELRVD